MTDKSNIIESSASMAAARRLSTADDRVAVEPHVAQLRSDGYTIVPNLVDQAALPALRDELDRIESGFVPFGGDFLGEKTIRTIGLVGMTRAFDPIIEHPTLLAIAESYLDDQITLAQSSSVTLHPGETRQDFHRDDECYPIPRPRAPMMINCFAALDDFTLKNGATRFYKGTHTQAEKIMSGEPEAAVMPAGSALVFDGALLHAGWGNTSDKKRRALPFLYNRAWLRGQENSFLVMPPEQLQQASLTLKRLLGYWTYGALLGHISGGEPISVLGLDS